MQPGLYMGWSDVTESMVTIRSPFCGYNTIQCVELNGDDLSCYSSKIGSISLRKCPRDYWLANKSYLSAITVTDISESFVTYNMASEMNWHRYRTRLRHCHSMYNSITHPPRHKVANTNRKSYLASRTQPSTYWSNDRKCSKSHFAPTNFGTSYGDEAITRIWVCNDRIGGKAMRSAVSVLSVHLFSVHLLNQLTFDLEFFMLMGHDHSSPGTRKSQSEVNAICVRYTSIYCGVLWVLTDGRSSRFPLWRDQLRASAARRAASSSGEVQRVWVRKHGRSDLHPWSSPCFLVHYPFKNHTVFINRHFKNVTLVFSIQSWPLVIDYCTYCAGQSAEQVVHRYKTLKK